MATSKGAALTVPRDKPCEPPKVEAAASPPKAAPKHLPYGNAATCSTQTFCDGSLGRARERSFSFLTRPLRWKRDRSLASMPGSADLRYGDPFDELICMPAAE
jgi:hypothetical protein